MKFQYKLEKSFEDRRAESDRVAELYPDRLPIIVEKFSGSRLPDLSNKKYLVEKDSTAAQFLYTIRKRLNVNVSSHETIFFFCKQESNRAQYVHE